MPVGAAIGWLLLGAAPTMLVLVLARWLLSPSPVLELSAPSTTPPEAPEDVQTSEGWTIAMPSDTPPEVVPPPLDRIVAELAEAVRASAGTGSDSGLDQLARSASAGQADPVALARQWEIRFPESITPLEYAQQLEHFGIELGAVMPGNRIVYVSGLLGGKPKTRIGPADQERRYYLTWRGTSMEQLDRELLARAGVDASDRPVLKFLPPAVESLLAGLEQQHAGPRADRVRKTRFGIRAEPDGFAFFVIDQWYR